jgi:REP element-mobilizing transposase RayT
MEMSAKHKDQYRKSMRASWWDYGENAAYFVTICTKNREWFFGTVENKIMHLSNTGIIADVLWYEIKNHARNVELDEFTVMPNHIHGILILNGNNNKNTITAPAVTPVVGTTHALSLQQSRFQNQGKNTLSSIIGSYKSAVTKHAHRLGFNFAWQSRFHDHIIRNEQEFQRIATYIKNNPMQWENDEFY